MLMMALMSSSSHSAEYMVREGSRLDGRLDAERGTSRASRPGECMPPYHSCTPARLPCRWTSSHMARRLRTSPSSHRRAEV
ncbi:hypothetical protein D3C78_1577300 [compost metagenome]